MTPDFEWITSTVIANDGDTRVQMWYLVDPSGRVRADIETPSHGRPTFITDIYWEEVQRYSHWVNLELAKAMAETAYMELLAKATAPQLEVVKKKSWLSSILQTLRR